MALELPGIPKLFKQTDVRETVQIEPITAGEGIDITVTEGVPTIDCELATTSNKGVASFTSADFGVSSGVVSLDDDVVSTIDGDSGRATGATHNIDILGGTGISTAGSSNDITITNDGVTSAVAGEGIDVSAATGAVTISCEDSTAGNKGVIIVSPGEGMDVSYSSGTATVSGEDATITNKGIASFATADFGVSSGAVSLGDDVVKDVGTDSGAVTPSTHNVSIVGGEGIDTSGATDTVTIAGEDATTTNKGVASFNTNDFTVSSGAVSLKNKTAYYTIHGTAFVPGNNEAAVDYDSDGVAQGTGVEEYLYAPVCLPHGAVITAAVVYGTSPNWYLERFEIADQTNDSIASAGINTEDTTISNATVDNENYIYYFRTDGFTDGDKVYGGRITYTTDYD